MSAFALGFALKIVDAIPMVFALAGSGLLWRLTIDGAPVEVVAAIACILLSLMGLHASREARRQRAEVT